MQATTIILCQQSGRAQRKYTTGFETSQINHSLGCKRERDCHSSGHAVMMKETDLVTWLLVCRHRILEAIPKLLAYGNICWYFYSSGACVESFLQFITFSYKKGPNTAKIIQIWNWVISDNEQITTGKALIVWNCKTEYENSRFWGI